MNIVLVGKTGSGKTSICNWLTDNLRYDKIVTYTTRQKRQNEVDGRDYYFVDNEYFVKNDLSLVTNNFGEYYGVDPKFENEDNKVLIVDPRGLFKIQNKYKNFIHKSFFIKSPPDERRNRCCNRGDSPMILIARMESENDSYIDVKTDYVVNNFDGKFNDSIIYILEKVKEACDCLPQNCTK